MNAGEWGALLGELLLRALLLLAPVAAVWLISRAERNAVDAEVRELRALVAALREEIDELTPQPDGQDGASPGQR